MEIEFVKVLNPWGESFGGNQSSFGNYPDGKRIKRCGCGLIAACDMRLFLNKTNVISCEEYIKFVCQKAKELRITDSFGIPPQKMIKMLSANNEKYDFRFIPKRKMTEKTLSETIAESISEGFPVIVRVGENFRKLPYKMNGAERRMRWHYFTVTGIDSDRLTFCSWGRKGEMKCSDLHLFWGFTGGIIKTTNKK